MSKGPATARELYDILRPLQEKKGYYFNKDEGMTFSLLEQLLVTKSRYGYMACPCRFANGEYEKDKDIVCPCTYREPDIEEYGECYCGLYVSKARNRTGEACLGIPDRRPPENILL